MASPLDLDHAASDIDNDLVEYTLPVGDGSMRAPGTTNMLIDAGSVLGPDTVKIWCSKLVF